MHVEPMHIRKASYMSQHPLKKINNAKFVKI
jgi:hypothetical protein